jgi:CBS domain-containing protein
MSIRKYCLRTVRTATPETTVRAAAQQMQRECVGSLVVADQGRPIGVVTDRDIALQILGADLDADKVLVRDVMQSPVASVAADASLTEAVKALRKAAVRRLVAVDGEGKLVGLFAADDLLRIVATELGDLGEALRVQLSREAKAAPRGAAERGTHA